MVRMRNIKLGYRWLGAAGIELRADGESLLIDPYVTRLPWHHMFFHHVQSNIRWVKELITNGDHILVTHAHIDHLLDVSTVMDQTGAPVYGSQNTCRLLQALGMDESKIHIIKAGDRFTAGVFDVSVFFARHYPVPFFLPGAVPVNTKPPRTARQYRMDSCFSYLIEVGGIRILVDSGKREHRNLPADVLVIHPFYGARRYRRLFEEVRPKLVIPNHWDNFMAPFSRVSEQEPFRHDWVSLLVRQWVLPRFGRMIQGYSPEINTLIPQIFQVYDLAQ
jgi:L-ascorbate metabolism protein UlaG (beta-lactamase superfamily)